MPSETDKFIFIIQNAAITSIYASITKLSSEGWVPVNRFNHTSWMTCNPTDRPKSVRNRCVIEVLVEFVCCPLVFEYSVGIGGFFIGLGKISFFSLPPC